MNAPGALPAPGRTAGRPGPPRPATGLPRRGLLTPVQPAGPILLAADDDARPSSSGRRTPAGATPADSEPQPPSATDDARAARVKAWRKTLARTPWNKLMLELSAFTAKTDQHYLERRSKNHWFGRNRARAASSTGGGAPRSAFPRVPADDFSEIEAAAAEPGALWRKALPLAAIFFCASFNLTILQNLKDAILVTAAGAEALPILSAVGVLPASLAFFAFYSRCVEALPPRSVFYAAVAPLVGFYALFAAVIYPASAWLHPAGLAARWAPSLPAGLAGVASLAEHWTFALFFCVAELWGPAVIALLFWSLANEVCSVRDAKAIYPLMGIAANVALVCSGSFVKWVSANARAASSSGDAGLGVLVATVAAMTAVMCGAKAWVDARVPRPGSSDEEGGGGERPASAPKKASPPRQKKKAKQGWADTAATLSSSPLISNLALLVVGYGVSHRLFEFAWKGALRALHPSAAAYQAALADVSIATGWLTIGLMLGGRLVFQVAGWTVAAAATPAVMLAAGGAFFGLSLAAGAGVSVAGLSPGALAAAGVAAGSLTQVFARSSKFSLFDPAKEMVYIEMDAAVKKKGKAAVDLVGSQVGKSGGAWVTQALLMATGSLSASMGAVAAVYVGVILAWGAAVGRLGQQMADADAAAAARDAAALEERAAYSARLAAAAAAGAAPKHASSPVVDAPLTAASAAAAAKAAREAAAEGVGVTQAPA